MGIQTVIIKNAIVEELDNSVVANFTTTQKMVVAKNDTATYI